MHARILMSLDNPLLFVANKVGQAPPTGACRSPAIDTE
jgi:hypothetical protein